MPAHRPLHRVASAMSVAAIVVVCSSAGSVSAQTISTPPPAITVPDCPTFEPDAVPATSPSPTIPPSPVVRAELPVLRGRWDTAGSLAIAPRTGAAVIVTPFEPFGTLLWGGVGPDGALLGDGAVIDGTGQARALPPSPLCPRRDFAASLGIDGQATIWGGVDQAGQSLADGATFSFETGTWTYLPPSVLPGGPAVMAGGLVVVADPTTGAPVAALLRSAEAAVRWDGPITVPVAAGERYAVAACCPPDSNEDVTVYSVHADGIAEAIRSRNLYSSFGRDWVPLGKVPYPALDRIPPTYGHAQERDQLVWFTTADAVVGEDEVPAHTGIAFDASDTSPPWGLLEPAPDGVAGDPSLTLSPTHLISVEGMAAYDLGRDRWLRLPRRDDQARFGDPVGATAWWQDGRLWVFGGRTPDGSMESLLWVFTPRLPRGTYALPVTRGPIGCEVRPDRRAPRSAEWRLTGDPADPMRVWAEWRGLRQQLWWPEGWTVRFRPRLVVQDTTGAFRARGGETCRLTSGSGG